MSTPPLVIVGCGAAKQSVRTTAGQMYVGSYHRACRRAAAAATTPARTLILSAAHGLLRLDDEIDPYNLRMGQPGAVGADQVLRQATTQGLLDETPIVLAGTAYTSVASTVWPTAHTPLAGVGGMGKQLAALARHAQDPASLLPYRAPTPGPDLIRPGLRVEALPERSSPKNGGRYGGTIVAVTERNVVVACHDGITRRFPTSDLIVSGAPLLVEAWKHLGYIDPTTKGRTTDDWEWLDWTVAEHLAYPKATPRAASTDAAEGASVEAVGAT